MYPLMSFQNFVNYDPISSNDFVKVGLDDYDEYTASMHLSATRINAFMSSFEKHGLKYFLKFHVDYCPTNAYMYFRIYLGSNLVYSRGISYSTSEDIELDITNYFVSLYNGGPIAPFALHFTCDVSGVTTSQGTSDPDTAYVKVYTQKCSDNSKVPEFYVRNEHYLYTNVNAQTLNYSLSDSGSIEYDPFNRNLRYIKYLFNVDACDVSFPFILIYDNNHRSEVLSSYNIANGIYTSFDMRYFRKFGYSDLLGDKGIILINEIAKRVDFNQKWYYEVGILSSKVKVYVDVSELEVVGGVVKLKTDSRKTIKYEVVSENGLEFVEASGSTPAYLKYQNGLRVYFDINQTLDSISNERGVYKIKKNTSNISIYKNNSLVSNVVSIDASDSQITCNFGDSITKTFTYTTTSYNQLASLTFNRDNNLTGTITFNYSGNLIKVSDNNSSNYEISYNFENEPISIKYNSGVIDVGYDNNNSTVSTKLYLSISNYINKTIITDNTNSVRTTYLFDFDGSIVKKEDVDLDYILSNQISSLVSTNLLNKYSLNSTIKNSNLVCSGTFSNNQATINFNTSGIGYVSLNKVDGLIISVDLSSMNRTELELNKIVVKTDIYDNSNTIVHTLTAESYVHNESTLYFPTFYINGMSRAVINISFLSTTSSIGASYSVYKGSVNFGPLGGNDQIVRSYSNDSIESYEYWPQGLKIKHKEVLDKFGNTKTYNYEYLDGGYLSKVQDNFNNIEEYIYDNGHKLIKKINRVLYNPNWSINQFSYDINDRPIALSLQKNSSTNDYDESYSIYYGKTNTIKEAKLFNGQYTKHDIDLHTQNTSVFKFSSQPLDKTRYKYKNGLLKELSSHSLTNSFKYTYDYFERIKKITLPNDSYITKTYDDHFNDMSLGIVGGSTILSSAPLTYDTLEYYTKDSKLVRIDKGTSKVIEFTYDSRDRLTTINSKLNGITDEYQTITYDDLDKVTATSKTMNNKTMYNFYYYLSNQSNNSNGLISSKTISLSNNQLLNESYTYNNEGKITDINASSKIYSSYTYYPFYKPATITYKKNSIDTLYTKTFTYYTDLVGQDTNHLPLVQNIGVEISGESGLFFSYKYDTTGNIVEESLVQSENTVLIAKKYVYDAFNRIIREKDYIKLRSTHFEYDDDGDIESSRTYSMNSSGVEGSLISSRLFDYDNDWKNQITGHTETGSSPIYYEYDYDALGRPDTYCGQTIVYDYYNNISSIGSTSFTYNNGGVRLSKTSNGFTHLYYYDDSKLIKEEVVNLSNNTLEKELVFIYNGDEVIGFTLNNVLYYYIKNLSGDVIYIYRASDNTKVGEYSYNAFGESNVEYDVNGITSTNPFRYKSYYYDIETGLYYLITRYYSSRIMRFITPDSTQYINPDSINGVNLYMYCGNNPVMYIDPEGHLAFFILTAIIGGIAGGIAAGIISHQKGARGWEVFGWTMLGVFGGAALGAAGGTGISMLLTGSATSSIASVYYGAKAAAWAFAMNGGAGVVDFFTNNLSLNNNYYPPNNGFAFYYSTTMNKGDYIQRIGSEYGFYFSPYYTDPFSLSLPYETLSHLNNLSIYEVIKPFEVLGGPAIPYYGQYGGGIQYYSGKSIVDLIIEGFIKRI